MFITTKGTQIHKFPARITNRLRRLPSVMVYSAAVQMCQTAVVFKAVAVCQAGGILLCFVKFSRCSDAKVRHFKTLSWIAEWKSAKMPLSFKMAHFCQTKYFLNL